MPEANQRNESSLIEAKKIGLAFPWLQVERR